MKIMKKILLACASGIATSTAVNHKLSKVLDEKGSKPITCQLHYLKPIPYEEYAGMKTNEIAALVKARVQECIDANT